MRCPAPQRQKGVHMRMPKTPPPHSARQLLRPLSGTSAQQLLQQQQLSSTQRAGGAIHRWRLGLPMINCPFQRCLLGPARPLMCCSLMLVMSHALGRCKCAAPAAGKQGVVGTDYYHCDPPQRCLVTTQEDPNRHLSSLLPLFQTSFQKPHSLINPSNCHLISPHARYDA